MGLIQFDKPWTRPTPDGVGASKEWIGRGLVALFDARYGIERISGDRASVNTATRAVSEGGVAADFSGTANQRYAHRPAYAQTGPFSLLILCDIDALSNYGALIAKQNSPTTHCAYELRVGNASADSKFNLVRATAGGIFRDLALSGSNRFTAPASLLRIVVSVNNNDLMPVGSIYVNGVSNTFSGTLSSSSVTDDGSSPVWIGRRLDGATQLDGRIYHVGLLNRDVTAGEAYEFIRNPWAVFEPKCIWVPVSAGGGGTTPVSSDRSLSWAVRSGVRADQSLAYPVKNAAQQDQPLAYAVKNAAEQSQSLAWTLRAGVQASQALAWPVSSSAQASMSLGYSLRNGVQAGLPISYGVSASIQRQLDLAWSVLNSNGIPVLSDATVFNITGTTARLRVTVTF